MTSEWLLNMSIEVLYLPKNFYAPQNKVLATPLHIIHCLGISMLVIIQRISHSKLKFGTYKWQKQEPQISHAILRPKNQSNETL